MDGEKGAQDELRGGNAAPSGLPSGSQPNPSGNGNQEKTITLTETELHNRIQVAAQERHSTLDQRIEGLVNQLSSLNALKGELDQAKLTINNLQQQSLAAELEAAKDNPDAYAAVKKRQELAQKEADILKRETAVKSSETTHQAELTEAKQIKLEKQLGTVADALVVEFPGIKKSVLLKFGGTTPESMRESAVELHKEFLAGKPQGGSQTQPGGNNSSPGGNAGQAQVNEIRPGSGASPGSATPLSEVALCESELAQAKGAK